VDVEEAGVQKYSPLKSGEQESLECVHFSIRAGDRDTRGDGTGRGGVFGTGRGERLATSCVSYCSYAVLHRK